MSNLSKLQKLLDREYRDAYLESHVKSSIAYQIQALREKTRLSQADFGALIGKPQSVVSRLENTEYGALNVNTLLEIAAALEIGLQVRFADFETVIRSDVSPAAMMVENIAETVARQVAVQSMPVASVSPAVSTVIATNRIPLAPKIGGTLTWQISLLANHPLPLPFQGSATPNSEKSILIAHS